MTRFVYVVAIALSSSMAFGQNLFLMPQPPMPVGTEGQRPDPATPLYSVSMTAVVPPPPRSFKVHDLVTIIVEETSRQQADQTSKSDKTYNVDADLNSILDPIQLSELRLRSSSISDLELLRAAYKQKFDGKGTYTRNDSFSMKIQAEIIDVKPNGTVSIEARKHVDKNGETQSTVLSGVCRISDITQNNSILSSQIADLALITKSTGEVNKSARKGLIPRILETIFAF
jgi:flagellar L-ring protein FlgH